MCLPSTGDILRHYCLLSDTSEGLFYLLSLLIPYSISFSICSSSSPLLFLTSTKFCYCYQDPYTPLTRTVLVKASEKGGLYHVCPWWLKQLPHADSPRTDSHTSDSMQTTAAALHCSLLFSYVLFFLFQLLLFLTSSF